MLSFVAFRGLKGLRGMFPGNSFLIPYNQRFRCVIQNKLTCRLSAKRKEFPGIVFGGKGACVVYGVCGSLAWLLFRSFIGYAYLPKFGEMKLPITCAHVIICGRA